MRAGLASWVCNLCSCIGLHILKGTPTFGVYCFAVTVMKCIVLCWLYTLYGKSDGTMEHPLGASKLVHILCSLPLLVGFSANSLGNDCWHPLSPLGAWTQARVCTWSENVPMSPWVTLSSKWKATTTGWEKDCERKEKSFLHCLNKRPHIFTLHRAL